MSARVVESAYVCEDSQHRDSKNATPQNPVIRLEVDGWTVWRCVRCLFRMSTQTNEPNSECTECSNTATVCEDHGITRCEGCGEAIETAFCDASCALGHGYDGGHECYSSCSWCGNEAHYCSVGCAIADGDDQVDCNECGNDYQVIRICDECRKGQEAATGSPQQAKAASSVATVTDDGSVSVDGIEFRF